jgi:hypothetical protein
MIACSMQARYPKFSAIADSDECSIHMRTTVKLLVSHAVLSIDVTCYSNNR